MTTITIDGTERHVHYRRVPGYFNGSTYHVDVDGKHLLSVVRTSDATWNRSATWAAYRPGVDWSLSVVAMTKEERDARHALFLTTGTSRELAVRHGLRKLEREVMPVGD